MQSLAPSHRAGHRADSLPWRWPAGRPIGWRVAPASAATRSVPVQPRRRHGPMRRPRPVKGGTSLRPQGAAPGAPWSSPGRGLRTSASDRSRRSRKRQGEGTAACSGHSPAASGSSLPTDRRPRTLQGYLPGLADLLELSEEVAACKSDTLNCRTQLRCYRRSVAPPSQRTAVGRSGDR